MDMLTLTGSAWRCKAQVDKGAYLRRRKADRRKPQPSGCTLALKRRNHCCSYPGRTALYQAD